MNLAADGNNFFHTGWLTRFLGLPCKHPSAEALRSEDVAAFTDGWQMCDETPTDGYPNRLIAFYAMKNLGHVSAFWVEDYTREVEV